MACFGFRIIWAYADFDGTAERYKPNREPVDGHALHAPTEDLGECRLVRSATTRRLQLCEFASLDGVAYGDDESAFRGEFRRFGRRKTNVSEHVTAALINRDLGHCSFLQVQHMCAVRLVHHLVSAIRSFDFFIKARNT